MLYYVSHNPFKCEEVVASLKERGIPAEAYSLEIKEIQSASIEEIACDKAKKAYAKIKRPLLVEQTGLILENYNIFPGGLTQPVWDALGAVNFCKLFKGQAAKAVSVFAYCDGINISPFFGEIRGHISNEPNGESQFQWDRVFIPEHHTVTFSEMTPAEKNEISMRRKAIDAFTKVMAPKRCQTMSSNAIDEIREKLAKQELILFVGAGIPRCIGLPNWEGLIDFLAGELGYEQDLFKSLGDYPTLVEYFSIQNGGVNGIVEWMRKNWLVDEKIVKASKVYENLVKLGCKRIYTTNYEDSIEKAYQLEKVEYESIATIQDFVGINPEAAQIIKFHGDLTKSTNLVLTENDYYRRLDFESPLDIKLRADIIGKSVLFLGYSLSDINMRYLIYKLNSLWKDTTERPRSYIFLASPNPISSTVFENWGITPVVGSGIDRIKNMEEFLASLAAN